MNMNHEQLAELLAGIARSQQAIIDAVERANPGWRNTHMIPMLNTAANMRSADPRLIDLPSRILMRLQGRAVVDNAQIVQDLARLTGGSPAAAPAASVPAAAASDDLDFLSKK